MSLIHLMAWRAVTQTTAADLKVNQATFPSQRELVWSPQNICLKCYVKFMSVKKEREEGTTIVRLGHVSDSPYGLACSHTSNRC